MPLYRFKTIDLKGKIETGYGIAESSKDLQKNLWNLHKILLRNTKFKKRPWHRLSMAKQNIFLRHMAQCLEHSMTLHKALEEYDDTPLGIKEMKSLLLQQISHGLSLGDALSNLQFLDTAFLHYIRIAEESGMLKSAFKDLHEAHSRKMNFRQRIKKALIYPSLLLMLFLMGFVAFVPSFLKEIQFFIKDIGGTNISSSSLFFRLAENMDELSIILFLCTFLLLIGGTWVLFQIPLFSLQMNRFLYNFPWIGEFKNLWDVQKILLTLSHQQKVSLSLVVSLHLQERWSKNLWLKEILEQILRSIHEGYPFSEALQKNTKLSSFYLSIIRQGELTGTLNVALEDAVKMIQEEIETRSNFLAECLQPFLLILIGLFLAWGVISVFDPLYGALGTFQG